VCFVPITQQVDGENKSKTPDNRHWDFAAQTTLMLYLRKTKQVYQSAALKR
jgi:hypothetical protein